MAKLKVMFLLLFVCGLFVANGFAQVDTNYFKVKYDQNKSAYAKVALKRPITAKDSLTEAMLVYELKQGADTVYVVNQSSSTTSPVTVSLNVSDTCSGFAYDLVVGVGGNATWAEAGLGEVSFYKWSIYSDSALKVSYDINFNNPKVIYIPAKQPYSSSGWWDASALPKLFVMSEYGGLVRFYFTLEGK